MCDENVCFTEKGLICIPAVPRHDVDICFCSPALNKKEAHGKLIKEVMSSVNRRGLSSQGQKKLRKRIEYYLQNADKDASGGMAASKRSVLMFFAKSAISSEERAKFLGKKRAGDGDGDDDDDGDENGNKVAIVCFVSKNMCFI